MFIVEIGRIGWAAGVWQLSRAELLFLCRTKKIKWSKRKHWHELILGYDLIEWLMDRLCIEDSRKYF